MKIALKCFLAYVLVVVATWAAVAFVQYDINWAAQASVEARGWLVFSPFVPFLILFFVLAFF